MTVSTTDRTAVPAIAPSTFQLPPGPWTTVLDGLCAHFPAIGRAQWQDRMARGRVLDGHGMPIAAATPYRVGLCVRYWREVADEIVVPFKETVLYSDAHLLVADKPPFLPVTPAGRFVEETLLARLIHRTGHAGLVPLHRIDRLTSGLVMFSVDPASRAVYQALFREHRIAKRYEAIAAPLEAASFPLVRRTRIVPGEPFFRMREAPGEPNSETCIEVIARGEHDWRYALYPVTGRKHQLRVQMAGLGAPIRHDPLYPELADEQPDDHARPLQLLAQALEFTDPLSGERRRFESTRTLGVI